MWSRLDEEGRRTAELTTGGEALDEPGDEDEPEATTLVREELFGDDERERRSDDDVEPLEGSPDRAADDGLAAPE